MGIQSEEVVSFLENFRAKYPMYGEVSDGDVLHKLSAKYPAYAPILDKWDDVEYGVWENAPEKRWWDSLATSRKAFMPKWAAKRKMAKRSPRSYIQGLVHNAMDSFAQGLLGSGHQSPLIGPVTDKAAHDTAYFSQIAAAPFKGAGVVIAFAGLRKMAGSLLKAGGMKFAPRSLPGLLERGLQAAGTFGAYTAMGQSAEKVTGERDKYSPVDIVVNSLLGFFLSVTGETGVKLARKHIISNWKLNWKGEFTGGKLQKIMATTKNRAIAKAIIYERPEDLAEFYANMYKHNTLGATQGEWLASIINQQRAAGIVQTPKEVARFGKLFLEKSTVTAVTPSAYQAAPFKAAGGLEAAAVPVARPSAAAIAAPETAGAITTAARAGEGFVMGQGVPPGTFQAGFLTDPERKAAVDATLRQLVTQDAVEKATKQQMGAAYHKTRAKGEFLEQFETRREAGIKRDRAVVRAEDMPKAKGGVNAEAVAAKGVTPTKAPEPTITTPIPPQAPPEGLEPATLEPVYPETEAPQEIEAGVHKIEPPQESEYLIMQQMFEEAQRAIPGSAATGPRPLFAELERQGILLSWEQVKRVTGYRTRADLPKDLQRIVRKDVWRKGMAKGIRRPDIADLDLLAERALTPKGDLYEVGSQYRIDPRADLESQLMDILVDETTAATKRMGEAGQIYIPGPEDLRTALKTLHDFEPIKMASTPLRRSMGWMSKLHDISPQAAFQLKSAIYEDKIIQEDVRKAIGAIFGDLKKAEDRMAAILGFEDPAALAQFTPAQMKAAKDAHAFLDWLGDEQIKRPAIGIENKWPHTIKAAADRVRVARDTLLEQMNSRLGKVKTPAARERIVGEFRKRLTSFEKKIKKLDTRYEEVKHLWYFPHVIRGEGPQRKILGKLKTFFRVKAPKGRKYTMRELIQREIPFETDPATALAEEATRALSRIKAYDTLAELKNNPEVVAIKGTVTGPEWVEPVGIPELQGHVIRKEAWDAFQEMIRTDEITAIGRAFDKVNNYLKFIRFYNPLYMTFNNLKQQFIAGGLRPYSPTWYGDFLRAVKSFRNKDNLWKEGVRNHAFGRPYNYGANMTNMIQQTLDDAVASMPKRVWNDVARALNLPGEARQAPLTPANIAKWGAGAPVHILTGMHKGLYAATWGLDEILRIQTRLQLERIGYEPKEAWARALRFHANYDLMKPSARKWIRRIFLTGQYQTAMWDMYRHLADHPVEERGAIARMFFAKWITRALMLGGLGAGIGGGYFFWDYYRFVKVRDDEKENVVIFTGPQNIPEKYTGRIFGSGSVGKGLGQLIYALSGALPHYLLSLKRNRDWKGDPIYLPGDSVDVAGDLALFSVKESIAVSNEVLEKRGGLNRMLNYFTIVRYERPEASSRIAYSYRLLYDKYRPQQALLEKALDSGEITQERYDRGAESLRLKWEKEIDALDKNWEEYIRKAEEAGELAGRGFYDPEVVKVVTKDMIEALSLGLINFEKGKGETQ